MTDTVLTLERLSKRFDGNTVLKDISARVQAGEVIGLLGLNGAGKTTLLETALGFALPDGGSVSWFDRHPAATLPEDVKHRIGFVPQEDELLQQMTGTAYLRLIRGFYRHWHAALIDRLAAEWALPLDTRIGKLSLGQRQKLSILSALGHEPEVLILDEPVASLDPVARRQFLKEIVAMNADQGRTVLFSTHIVSDLERVAQRVWILKEGRLAVDEPIDVLKERTVRVHLNGREPAGLLDGLPAPASRRRHGAGEVLLFTEWEAAHAERLAGTGATVEALGLEDIFLELHA
jgi:ABC-2 type transport system ATP-binding protein